jgi:hypothetical protein
VTKRAHQKFIRKARDFYATPESALLPLLPHLPPHTVFDEPCAGDRHLVRHLESAGHQCARASDISDEPPVNALDIRASGAKMFITNPPWTRSFLHDLILHLSSILDTTWLLIDADWAHTKQSIPYMRRCRKIVSVGRVSWFGKTVGFDNCAWYLFYANTESKTQFIGRSA